MRKKTKRRINRLEHKILLLETALQRLAEEFMADGDVVAQKEVERVMKPIWDYNDEVERLYGREMDKELGK